MSLEEKNRVSLANRKQYACIDLKSFYASVECVERQLDPLKTNLVVADPERTEKTICLAITPPMKALGISSRCRVFEIPKNVDYIMAVPRMQLYIDYSARIYEVYLKYIAKEDIHPYSIDEVFMDVTNYLTMYQMTAKELCIMIMEDIYKTTGITATCGIGSNLYLAKVALDITAKHVEDHIGILDEEAYCKTLWDHRPLTDFWRVGPGTVRRLEGAGITTMRQITEVNEDYLYRLFGIDAELLIDHAWGREPVTIEDIKAFKPKHNSLTSGQVLGAAYDWDKARLVVKEMADLLCLDLVDKGLIAQSITLHIGYENRSGLEPSHGSIRTNSPTSSSKTILPYVEELYNRIVKPHGMIKRINISFNEVMDEMYQQYDLFSGPEDLERERRMQKAMIDIKKKFGKNAILKGMNLSEGATTIERNSQIGGHRSGD